MRYFYNIKMGSELILDEEGSQHPDMEEVRAEAVEAARELMAEAIRVGKDVSHQVFEIADDTGKTVAVVPFRGAILPAG